MPRGAPSAPHGQDCDGAPGAPEVEDCGGARLAPRMPSNIENGETS